MANRVSVEERFLAKVDQSDNCWTWNTPSLTNGYGRFWFEGRMIAAHCVAYRLFVGPIPVGMELDHLCHTRDLSCTAGTACLHRRCVRPDHLEPVTPLENARRARHTEWERALVTRCPQDHEYTPENTYIAPSGKRNCRLCKVARKQVKRPRSESLPRLCLNVLGAVGGCATTTEVLRQLQTAGRQSTPAHVVTALGRLADREQPLVAKTYQGIPGDNRNPSVWKITDAGQLLIALR